MEKNFHQWKKLCLNKLDLSKKGSVDEDIEQVVSLINSREEFFTTSSCSGRVILIDAPPEGDVQKKNCVWLFVSHQKCSPDDLVSALARSSGDAVFKFEPFVLHVQCQRLDDAQLVHSVAVNSGFRNSGITVGKTGKIITAVRSTHGLEVPLSQEGKVLVQPEYIAFLTQVANKKMEENLRRIHRFHQNLQSALPEEKVQKRPVAAGPPVSQEPQQPPGRTAKTNGEAAECREERNPGNPGRVYQRRRRRDKANEKDCCQEEVASPGASELHDIPDLFT